MEETYFDRIQNMVASITLRYCISYITHVDFPDTPFDQLDVPIDEAMEKIRIPGIASIFILNLVLRKLSEGKYMDEYPSDDEYHGLTEEVFKLITDYYNQFASSPEKYLKSKTIN